MTEFIAKPTQTNQDTNQLEWGDLAITGVDFIEPDATKRDDGFNLNEVVTYPFLNWLFRTIILTLTWLKSWKIRTFSATENAVSILAAESGGRDGHTFQLGKPGGFEAPFSTVFSIAGDKSPTAVLAMATDGEFIYYGQGNFVIRADRDGTKIAERDLGATVNTLTADGFAIVAGTVAQAGAEVYNIDRLTLADRSGWPLEVGQNIIDVSSDGNTLIFCTDVVNADTYLHTGAFLATLVHGAIVRAVAMDWKFAYVAGDAFGGFQIRAFFKGGGGAVWSVAIQGGTPLIFCMVSDGERLYITSTTVIDGGNNSNIRCLRIKDGVRLWRTLTPNTNALSACAVDEKYLYGNDGSGQGYVFDKLTGDCLHEYTHAAQQHSVAADGDALFMGGVESGGVGVIRYSRGNGSKMYIKADGADTNRRPFFNLAIPADY